VTAVFITGSGTGVGKTFVAANLLLHLRRRGQRVRALKPVVSGFDPANPCGSDPAILIEAAGRKVTPEEIDRVSPWRFRAPLSPDMAARAEKRAIDFDAVTGFCRSAIAEGGITVIEGIGGIMVPHRARFYGGATPAPGPRRRQLSRHAEPHAIVARGTIAARA
jgi:dethiobiotin synthetase